MPKRTAQARWEGNLKEGKGLLTLGSGAFEGYYSFGTRFEDTKGTNPEELIAAAHAGCYSMALSMLLEQAGVATVAGTSFGHLGEGYVRFSYANSVDNIRTALGRVAEALAG